MAILAMARLLHSPHVQDRASGAPEPFREVKPVGGRLASDPQRSRPLRVLVISHGAERQGAPLLLLLFMRWLHARGIEFELVLHRGGPLLADYREIASTIVLDPIRGVPRTIPRIVRTLRIQRLVDRIVVQRLHRRFRHRAFDVVWLNTVAIEGVVTALPPMVAPRILHVHELESAIQQVGPRHGTVRNLAERFIAASRAVADNLIERHTVDPGLIDVVYSCVEDFQWTSPSAASQRNRRVALGIDPDASVVVGCGRGDLRKGVDLLPRLAAALNRTPGLKKVEVVWVGAVEPEVRTRIESEVAATEGSSPILFTGELARPRGVFELADVFILPSREEPLGLVCLEAAQCGLPVVCFGGAGGAPEFVSDDSGVVVPYLDVDAMAGAVAYLLQDVAMAHRMGEIGRRRVADLFTVEQQAPRLLKILQQTANLG